MGKVAAVGHIITLTVLAWGHTKCACGMVAKAVRFKPIYATVFVGLPFFERTKKEIGSHFISGEEDHLRNLIRVVGLKCDALPYETTTLNDEFLKLYKKLLASESIPEQPESDVHLPAIEPPRLFVLDFFLNNTLYAVRSISGKSVPIYTLQSGGSTGILFLFSPEHLGGNGDLEEKLKKITTEDEEQRKKETIEIYRRCYGEVVKIPGLPPMYDYEFSPQESIFGHEISAFSAPVHKFFNESDGVVLNTIPEFEEDAINAVQSWFGDDPVFSTGPFDFSLIERKEETSPGALEVRAFLDKALKDHGPHSVLYISFGSMFWFKDPSKLLPFFEVLLEKRRPFIFSIASPFAMFPDEMRERILNSGLAYISSWAPQIDILNHEATGWFMSHCGHNSTIESLSAGVPMICCPFDADQPANAANLSHTHDVAYELFELRTGHGLRPIHRLGDRQPEGTEESVRREILEILEKASGPDGQRKRENARRFKEAIKRSWAPDGSNWKEIERLVNIASEKELRN